MTEVLFNGPEGKLQGYYKHVKNPKYVALILHPRECFENSMNNNIVSVLFESFNNKNYSTLKFNFRGVDKSQGSMDDGTGELSDAATALDWLLNQNPDVTRCWIGGVCFGSWVASQLLMRRPEIISFINVGVPLNQFDFSFLSPCPASGLILQPNKEITLEKKKIVCMVKKLSSQKNIKIIYKSIDSDINFKNKEKEIRKNIDMFISKIENSVK
tara:strand:- start:609 stop:1250 length:642 start_codon:yes stop_codon:yes gene_type:complete